MVPSALRVDRDRCRGCSAHNRWKDRRQVWCWACALRGERDNRWVHRRFYPWRRRCHLCVSVFFASLSIEMPFFVVWSSGLEFKWHHYGDRITSLNTRLTYPSVIDYSFVLLQNGLQEYPSVYAEVARRRCDWPDGRGVGTRRRGWIARLLSAFRPPWCESFPPASSARTASDNTTLIDFTDMPMTSCIFWTLPRNLYVIQYRLWSALSILRLPHGHNSYGMPRVTSTTLATCQSNWYVPSLCRRPSVQSLFQFQQKTIIDLYLLSCYSLLIKLVLLASSGSIYFTHDERGRHSHKRSHPRPSSILFSILFWTSSVRWRWAH